MQGGKLMEMGQLTTLDCDGTKTEYPFALLIEFKSAEDCKRALEDEQCRFDFEEYPAETPNDLGEGRERGILREASSGEAATSTDGLGVAVPPAPTSGD